MSLYDDTGLGDAETIIKEQYINGANVLRISLYDAIKNILFSEKVLGYSYDSIDEIYKITTTIESRRLFLSYKEIQESQIRIITDIEILRR
ncbi:MAG: hypothetical protein PHH70_04115 [Candidatus Gracilibacteria bacterium]|nr:hypothetical protein [Candidatus Gracilibacteria bacterium]